MAPDRRILVPSPLVAAELYASEPPLLIFVSCSSPSLCRSVLSMNSLHLFLSHLVTVTTNLNPKTRYVPSSLLYLCLCPLVGGSSAPVLQVSFLSQIISLFSFWILVCLLLLLLFLFLILCSDSLRCAACACALRAVRSRRSRPMQWPCPRTVTRLMMSSI